MLVVWVLNLLKRSLNFITKLFFTRRIFKWFSLKYYLHELDIEDVFDGKKDLSFTES